MASPAFIAAGTVLDQSTDISGSASGNVAVPAGVSNGDWMLLVIRTLVADAVVTPPAGWTSIDSWSKTSVNQSDLLLYYRVASSEPSDYAVSVDSSSLINAFVAQTFAWGAATFETSDKWEASSGSTTIPCPTVTSGGTDRTLICVYGQQGCNDTGLTYTPPSGMTERADSAYASGTGKYTSFSVADLAISSSGATGTKNATASSSSPWHMAVSVLIETSGGGGGGGGLAPPAMRRAGTPNVLLTHF